MPIGQNSTSVEVQVDPDVKAAALKRAELQNQNLAAVCRAVMNLAAKMPEAQHKLRPTRRRGADRARIRFTMNREQYIVARTRILERGGNISVQVEDGLVRYAHTGRVID